MKRKPSRLFLYYFTSCLAVALVVLLLCGVFIKDILINRFSQMRETDYTQMLEANGAQMEGIEDSFRVASIQIQSCTLFNQTLLERYPSRAVLACNYLQGVTMSTVCADSVAVCYLSNATVYQPGATSGLEEYCAETLDNAMSPDAFVAMMQSLEKNVLILTGSSCDGNGQTAHQLLYVSPIPYQQSTTKSGVVVFVLNKETVFAQLLQSIENNSGFLYVEDENNGHCYIVNSDPENPLVKCAQDMREIEADYWLTSVHLSENMVCTLGVSKEPVYTTINEIWRAAILAMGIIAAGSISAALLLAKWMYKPVHAIYRSMALPKENGESNEWKQIQQAVDELLRMRDMSFELSQNVKRQIYAGLLFWGGHDETQIKELFSLIREKLEYPNFIAAILAQSDGMPLAAEQIDAEQLSFSKLTLLDLEAHGEYVVVLFNTAYEQANVCKEVLQEMLLVTTAMDGLTLHMGSVETNFNGIHQSFKNALEVYHQFREQNKAEKKPARSLPAYQPAEGMPLNDNQHHLIERMIEYIDEHYASYDLTLNYLADRFKITPSYATKLFKEATGYSVKTYIDMKKIEQAKRLLKDTCHSIQAIAQLTGHMNTSNFNVKFKKFTGCTPQQYRRK